MYKRAFFSSQYVSANPEKEELLHRLRAAIEEQVAVIYRCIRLHAQLCPVEMRPFHETLERFFCQNFGDEIQRLGLDVSRLGTDVSPSPEVRDDSTEVVPASAASPTHARAPETPLQRHIGSLTRQGTAVLAPEPSSSGIGGVPRPSIAPSESTARATESSRYDQHSDAASSRISHSIFSNGGNRLSKLMSVRRKGSTS